MRHQTGDELSGTRKVSKLDWSLSPFLPWELLGSLKRLSAEGTFLGLQRILLRKEETLYRVSWAAGPTC